MIQEMESVVLNKDVLKHGLKQGDIGAVVHCYRERSAFEVEFVTADGRTIAVLTLDSSAVRPIREGEILHVREVATT